MGEIKNPVITIARWGRDGKRQRIILQMGFPRRVIRFERGGGTIVGKQPFEDGPLIQPAEDGSGFAVVERTVLPGRSRPSFGVTWITGQGDTTFSVKIPYTPHRVTSGNLAAAVSYLAGPPGADAGLESRIKDALFVPDHLPTVSGVAIGQEGAIWIRREEPTGPTVHWTILRSDGSVRGDVTANRDLVVRATLGDIVFGVVPDSLGVPQVHRYRLKPGR
jgi:hypothetical protein